MPTSSEAPARSALEPDPALDELILEVLKEHRRVSVDGPDIVCGCGQAFNRRGGKPGARRHLNHVSWALSRAIREEGYAYVGEAP